VHSYPAAGAFNPDEAATDTGGEDQDSTARPLILKAWMRGEDRCRTERKLLKSEKTEWRRSVSIFGVPRDSSAMRCREIEIARLSPTPIRSQGMVASAGHTVSRRNDILEIALDGRDHLIAGTREIYVR